ncbi:hypothetical protein KCP69_20390 [Salmonella enterica subsp. enterica]|nr:hypothetical protein KCP69_20390 [Salmonella enterica subsp. enterica]
MSRDPSIKAEPIQNGRQRGGGGSGRKWTKSGSGRSQQPRRRWIAGRRRRNQTAHRRGVRWRQPRRVARAESRSPVFYRVMPQALFLPPTDYGACTDMRCNRSSGNTSR